MSMDITKNILILLLAILEAEKHNHIIHFILYFSSTLTLFNNLIIYFVHM